MELSAPLLPVPKSDIKEKRICPQKEKKGPGILELCPADELLKMAQ